MADDNMKGGLWRAKERPSDKHPEFTGNLVINGVKYRLAAWVNEPKGGGPKYFSIKASEPRSEDQRQGGYGDAPRNDRPAIDDEIPF